MEILLHKIVYSLNSEAAKKVFFLNGSAIKGGGVKGLPFRKNNLFL